MNNHILTDLLRLAVSVTDINRQKTLLNRIPFLCKAQQWSTFVSSRKFTADLCCEFIRVSDPISETLFVLLTELEKCMNTNDDKSSQLIIQWCRAHPKEYEKWAKVWKRNAKYPTFGFDETLYQKENAGCQRLLSAMRFNAPYAKHVLINQKTLFPPDLIWVSSYAHSLPYFWFPLVDSFLVQVQLQNTMIVCETAIVAHHGHSQSTRRAKAEGKTPISIPTYVFTLWHEHEENKTSPWNDALPKLLQCIPIPDKDEKSADMVTTLDFSKECSTWFSATLTAMLNPTTKIIRYNTTSTSTATTTSSVQAFCRAHFNAMRVGLNLNNESNNNNNKSKPSSKPWILDNGYWFQHATEQIVQWIHRAKFLMNTNTNTNAKQKRCFLSQPWSSRDSERVAMTTALFGIRARENDNTNEKQGCKSLSKYIELAKKLFDWNVYLYVFIEPGQHVKTVYDERERRGLTAKTIILPTYMEQSRLWPTFERIQQLYQNKRIPQCFSPVKDTPLYVFSQATKYDCLQRSLRMNVFQTENLYWIDFGIHHVVYPPESYERLLRQLGRNQRLRVTYLRHLVETEIKDKERFFSRLQQAAAGGLIGGPNEQVQWLANEFEREFVDALKYWPVLDEAILGSLSLTYPDRFFGIQSGHAEMFQLRSMNNCLQHLRTAMEQGDVKRAYDIALELPSGSDAKQMLDDDDHKKRNVLFKQICKKLYQETKDVHYKKEEEALSSESS